MIRDASYEIGDSEPPDYSQTSIVERVHCFFMHSYKIDLVIDEIPAREALEKGKLDDIYATEDATEEDFQWFQDYMEEKDVGTIIETAEPKRFKYECQRCGKMRVLRENDSIYNTVSEEKKRIMITLMMFVITLFVYLVAFIVFLQGF